MNDINFDNVYAAYKEKVWQIISRYLANQHDREDLFQEVFLKIHVALPQFRQESAFETWLYRITVNTAINYLKKKKRHKLLTEILQNLQVVEQTEIVEDNQSEANKLLDKLNPRQKMIVVLADIEEKSLDEIGRYLKLPLGTVKSNLHRAREIVKRELSKNEKI